MPEAQPGVVMRKRMFATGGYGGEAGKRTETGQWKGEIDTRLVAAVHARAGSRVHEAAGLLNAYYLWSGVLEQAENTSGSPTLPMALDQVREAKRRLKEFLTEGRWHDPREGGNAFLEAARSNN
jgi:hypothetical protein